MITFDKLFGRANFEEVISIVKDDDFIGVTNVETVAMNNNHYIVAFDYKGYRCKTEYIVKQDGRVDYSLETFVAIKQSGDYMNHKSELKRKEEELAKYKRLLVETVKIAAGVQ